jgi:hypothetical protein
MNALWGTPPDDNNEEGVEGVVDKLRRAEKQFS